MSQGFFEISSPRDLLEKARRDFEKMKDDISCDTIFNFFITVYHVVDYVRAQGIASTQFTQQLYEESDFRMCNFICNKGKHMALKAGDPYHLKHDYGAQLGHVILGVTELGAPERFLVIDGTEKVDVLELGERLLNRWEQFFQENNIP